VADGATLLKVSFSVDNIARHWSLGRSLVPCAKTGQQAQDQRADE
jgi:hypothetical protein